MACLIAQPQSTGLHAIERSGGRGGISNPRETRPACRVFKTGAWKPLGHPSEALNAASPPAIAKPGTGRLIGPLRQQLRLAGAQGFCNRKSWVGEARPFRHLRSPPTPYVGGLMAGVAARGELPIGRGKLNFAALPIGDRLRHRRHRPRGNGIQHAAERQAFGFRPDPDNALEGFFQFVQLRLRTGPVVVPAGEPEFGRCRGCTVMVMRSPRPWPVGLRRCRGRILRSGDARRRRSTPNPASNPIEQSGRYHRSISWMRSFSARRSRRAKRERRPQKSQAVSSCPATCNRALILIRFAYSCPPCDPPHPANPALPR